MVILDACAVIAYLRNEEGTDIVGNALMSEKCYIHAINICEVYKDCLSRGEDRSEADQLLDDLFSAGLTVCEDMDSEFWKDAAELKASTRRISYADCIGLRLTNRLKGIFLTSDHHELDPLAKNDIYPIKFIR